MARAPRRRVKCRREESNLPCSDHRKELVFSMWPCHLCNGAFHQAGIRAAPTHTTLLKTLMANSFDVVKVTAIALASATNDLAKPRKPHSTVTSTTIRTRTRNPVTLLNRDSPSGCNFPIIPCPSRKFRQKKFKSRQQSLSQRLTGFDVTNQSGREDLNLRPHGPEPCALARLSYAPLRHY
jgi:hypothetical protein